MLRSVCSWWGPLACLDCSPADQRPDTSQYSGHVSNSQFTAAKVPNTLRRLMKGLQALGRPRVLYIPNAEEYTNSNDASVILPGPWCADAPLWGNPLALAHDRRHTKGPCGLQVLPRTRYINPNRSGGGLVRSTLHTVGDLVRALRVVPPLAARDPYRGPWADGDSEVDDLQQLKAAVPLGWWHAAESAVPQASGPLEAYLQSDGLSGRPFQRSLTQHELKVESDLVKCMGWKTTGRGQPVRLDSLTVKSGTELQLWPLYMLRAKYQEDFVHEFAPMVDRGDPEVIGHHVRAIVAAQRQLWRVHWDNEFKEVYWRLVLNGLATSERLHQQQCRCVCGLLPGGLPPGRRHHFWDCSVAKCVVQAMQQQLVGWCRGRLCAYNVLCMEPPRRVDAAHTLHKGVWRVVCLAAVNAMDVGRRAACQINVREKEQQGEVAAAQRAAAVPRGQRLITDMFQPAQLTPSQQQHQQQVRQRQQLQEQQQQQQQQQAAATQLAEVQQQAVAHFWELLGDFVALSAAPQSWLPQISPSHPFLHVTGDQVLCVHRIAVDQSAD
jgi:hypothetical protein